MLLLLLTLGLSVVTFAWLYSSDHLLLHNTPPSLLPDTQQLIQLPDTHASNNNNNKNIVAAASALFASTNFNSNNNNIRSNNNNSNNHKIAATRSSSVIITSHRTSSMGGDDFDIYPPGTGDLASNMRRLSPRLLNRQRRQSDSHLLQTQNIIPKKL